MLALVAIHRIHLRCIVFLLGGNTVGNNSFAVGIGAMAVLDDSYAIGRGSVANRAAGVSGYRANGRTNATWQATGNAVAVGDSASSITRQITGVAAGSDDTDAVNVAQLKDAIRNSAGKIPDFDGEIQATAAQSAALSALKPVSYDPLEPTQVMAGYGYYKSNSAFALGVAHYQRESLLFNFGAAKGAGNNHHYLVNMGVTYKFGNVGERKAVPERYRGGPISAVYVLEDEMTAMKEINQGLVEKVAAQDGEIQSLKQEVADLKGIVKRLIGQ